MKKLFLIFIFIILNSTIFSNETNTNNQQIINDEIKGHYFGITMYDFGLYGFTYKYCPETFGFQITLHPMFQLSPLLFLNLFNLYGIIRIHKSEVSSLYFLYGGGISYSNDADANDFLLSAFQYIMRKNTINLNITTGINFEHCIYKNITMNYSLGYTYNYSYDLQNSRVNNSEIKIYYDISFFIIY